MASDWLVVMPLSVWVDVTVSFSSCHLPKVPDHHLVIAGGVTLTELYVQCVLFSCNNAAIFICIVRTVLMLPLCTVRVIKKFSYRNVILSYYDRIRVVLRSYLGRITIVFGSNYDRKLDLV